MAAICGRAAGLLVTPCSLAPRNAASGPAKRPQSHLYMKTRSAVCLIIRPIAGVLHTSRAAGLSAASRPPSDRAGQSRAIHHCPLVGAGSAGGRVARTQGKVQAYCSWEWQQHLIALHRSDLAAQAPGLQCLPGKAGEALQALVWRSTGAADQRPAEPKQRHGHRAPPHVCGAAPGECKSPGIFLRTLRCPVLGLRPADCPARLRPL